MAIREHNQWRSRLWYVRTSNAPRPVSCLARSNHISTCQRANAARSISHDAKRVEQWVKEAIDGGAKLICGGRRNGVFYDATLLENVEPHMRISCQEVFGPVATMQPFVEFRDAVRVANDSVYGLQAGVFTKNLDHAFYAFNELEVGGVIINDVPSFRVDHMPYGGVKDSGFGREGVRFAMEEMTEIRLMVMNRLARV